MTYLRRSIDTELDELLPYLPAIALDGPKGVGKTETAARRVSKVLNLDDDFTRTLLHNDFNLDAYSEESLLFDEWQHFPRIWDIVRRKVDSKAPAGSYLLTGSATPYDTQGSHSGAGRIVSLRMRPMGLHERSGSSPSISFTQLLNGEGIALPKSPSPLNVQDYAHAIVASGFPGITGLPPRVRRQQLDSYLHRVIDRDIPDIGAKVRHPESLRRWLAAYAAAESTTTSYSKLLNAAVGPEGTQPSATTTRTYREHLSKLWLLDPVPGWVPANNQFKRLQQAPKHHLADPALSAHLLQVDENSLMSETGSHLFGPLFEALVTLTVRVIAQTVEAKVSHLRLDSGTREVDLLVERHDGKLIAIEVKLKGNPTDKDVRHLNWLKEELPDRVVNSVVITAGQGAYRRADGIYVIPLAMLGQ
ncbi:MAG: DUF4143 domain-containing protein [Rothia sp. (in: high G+C Gram-positive bacteria)]|nr:DUF4143 domain-containing protein [Rothia sp. (in: high G+C Gram-positive bacteria)]